MEVSHRMAGLWRVHGDWRTHGYCQLPNPDVVHLYFFSHTRLAPDRIHGARLLDEYETVYPDEKAESAEMAVS